MLAERDEMLEQLEHELQEQISRREGLEKQMQKQL